MNKVKKQKISVIINCFNLEEDIEDIILSVLNQTYTNIEIIIINDGSTDNSGEIIKFYAERYRNIIFFDEQEHNGDEYNRNWAIEAATGEYVLLLNTKDKLDLNFIDNARKNLNENILIKK